jgi:quinohemoprotein ethanol dehydrogenase
MKKISFFSTYALKASLATLAITFVAGVALAAGNVTEERIRKEATSGANWFLKGGGFDGAHYSPLTQITDDNVASLGLAWSTNLPTTGGIATTPIVVDGVVYLSGEYSMVYAVDALNGKLLWSYDPEVKSAFAENPRLSWIARAHRGIALWDGKVFLTTADCKLIALDASDGKPLWSKTTCDTALDYFISDSPYVGGGKVFVGNGGSESQKKNRGYVSAYGADNGNLVWRFYIVPSDDPAQNNTPALKMAAKTWSGDALAKHGGGGNSWNEMTYDPVSNQLFFGTSGAYPYVHAERSPAGGDNLFLSSIVAVDADTGEYNWHYQTVDKDSWDYNATMNIVLADLTVHDIQRETLLIAPKNGFHYTLDRHTGELLVVGKFAKTNWATDIDVETGKPNYSTEGEFWNQDDGEISYVWPNMWGSHSWNPMAFHPGHGLTYIPVVDLPSRVGSDGDGEGVAMVTEVDGRPHAPGKLVAFDPTSGRIRWSVDHALPYNGGLMTTAGNLLFQGNAEGKFEAYAADTGERLWSVATASAINSAPASYEIDGTQYVLIPIGAGGGLQYQYPQMHSTLSSQGPTQLLAFSLEAEGKVSAQAVTMPKLPEQPKLLASATTIELGATLYAGYCKYCHGKDAVSRIGRSVPDLRYATTETHVDWDAIVVGGSKRMNGMPGTEITVEYAQAIRNYVLSLSEQIRVSTQ